MINKPTRVTQTTRTLIDHIYTNIDVDSLLTGVVLSDISDHYGIFINANIQHINKKKMGTNFVRDLKNFDLSSFLNELSVQLTKLPINQIDAIDTQFNNFVSVFNDAVNTHASLRKATRKEKRLQSKPWLTAALLKSIKSKNKMYAQNT